MKLCCMKTPDVSNTSKLQVGRLHEVHPDDSEYLDRLPSSNWRLHYKKVSILVGEGEYFDYPLDCFLTLEDCRNGKLESIGI